MDEIKKDDLGSFENEMLINYAKRVLKLPDCNTCVRRKVCKYAPGWGEWVRINCMFYEGYEKC